MSTVIEYRCLDCGRRYPYGELVKDHQDTCPLCGYELVPVAEGEMDDSYQPAAAVKPVGPSPSIPRLIGVFVGVSGLIFALALWLPK